MPTYDTEAEARAYNSGRIARLNNIGPGSNPFAKRDALWCAWDQGWREQGEATARFRAEEAIRYRKRREKRRAARGCGF